MSALAAGRLDRLADRDAQAARRVRVGGEHVRARLGGPGRAGVHGGAPGLHHRAPVRLLVVGGADHPDLAVDAVLGAGEGQRAAPLAGAGLGGEPLGALGRVVVRLRDRGVRLVRPGRGHALVLVVDPRGGVQRLFQPVRAVQRGGPPQPVDVEHVGRDVDVGVGGHFLADELHREQRREVLRAHRLERPRVQRRGRRRGQVGDHVVPLAGDLGLIQSDLGALRHDRPPTRVWNIFSEPYALVGGTTPRNPQDPWPPYAGRRTVGPGRQVFLAVGPPWPSDAARPSDLPGRRTCLALQPSAVGPAWPSSPRPSDPLALQPSLVSRPGSLRRRSARSSPSWRRRSTCWSWDRSTARFPGRRSRAPSSA